MCGGIQSYVWMVDGIILSLESYQREKKVVNDAVNDNFSIICMINFNQLIKVLKN